MAVADHLSIRNDYSTPSGVPHIDAVHRHVFASRKFLQQLRNHTVVTKHHRSRDDLRFTTATNYCLCFNTPHQRLGLTSGEVHRFAKQGHQPRVGLHFFLPSLGLGSKPIIADIIRTKLSSEYACIGTTTWFFGVCLFTGSCFFIYQCLRRSVHGCCPNHRTPDNHRGRRNRK